MSITKSSLIHHPVARHEREKIMQKALQLMRTPEKFDYPTLGDFYDWLLKRNRRQTTKSLT